MISRYESSAKPAKAPGPSLAPLGLLILRLGAGLTLLYVQGWNLAIAAWEYLWNGQPWRLIDQLTQAQLPLPNVLAVISAIVLTLTSASWILGFATRFISAITLPVMAMTMVAANRTGMAPSSETSTLYFFVALCLMVSGPGWVALDSLFKARRRKKTLYV